MAGDQQDSYELAGQQGLCYVDLSRTGFAPDASALLPEEIARRERAVPIERRGTVTVIAVATPADDLTLDALRAACGGEVVTVVAPGGQVTTALAQLYGDGATRTARRRAPAAPSRVGHAMRPPGGPPGPDWTLPEGVEFGESTPLFLPDVEPLGEKDPSDSALAWWSQPGEDQPPPAPGGSESPVASAASEVLAPPVPSVPEGWPATSRNGAPADVEWGAPGTSHQEPPANGSPSVGTRSPTPPPPPPPPPPPGFVSSGAKAVDDARLPDGDAPSDTPSGESSGARTDALADALSDALSDVLADAPPDAPSDALADAPPDALADALSDAASDVLADLPPDAEPHALSDAPSDVLADLPPDAGPDAVSDGPSDAPADTEPDAPPELPPGSDAWPTLARALVLSGTVGAADMEQALGELAASGESLSQYLRREELATEEDLLRAMAGEVGLEFVDLSAFTVDPVAASLVPGPVARRHMVLPYRFDSDGTPVVAMANPTDVFAMDDLRSIIGRTFRAVVATREHLDFHLKRLLEPTTDVQAAAQSAAGTVGPDAASEFELESLQAVVDDAPIVRYVNLLILQALNERASDIHIEPTPRFLKVRFRIDGVMHDASSASPAIHSSVISRLKVLGDMDITEHRVPQEGRVSVTVGERQIDLRLAIVPSLYGETCVMRLLDKSASIRQLSELGFLPETLGRYAHAYNQPYGVILVTGPTGAGKTTTLYATLQEVMSDEKAVVTVEDPVEYQIRGITQVQINPKAGLKFSNALRSILRADPDIILVGEIRDIETASIAMEAALSGHLVLSTLHTNTAASTPLRLTEMGVEPFLVTSAVRGVLTQRLARVLCERCKEPYEATTADFVAAGYKESDLDGLDGSVLHRANGCPTCSHTGYYGRMLLGEVMPLTEEIERMIIEEQSIVSIERMAVTQGMRTLRQDGLRKAIAGYTTLEEVLRVVI